jgi:hypothetical protein
MSDPPPPVPPSRPAPPDSPGVPSIGRPRWLRVRVTDSITGKPKVNLRVPMALVNVGLKIGARYSPEIEGIDIRELLEAAGTLEPGPFVDVYDEEDGEHVEIYLE